MNWTTYPNLTKAILTATALAVLPSAATRAADISWNGGSASYTNAAHWVGGAVPGFADNAINDTTTNNLVQINVGDPDWTVGQIRAGNSAGNGAYVQNGQTVTVLGTNYNGPVISEFFTPFRLGIVAADTGVYTLNGGTLNYGTGPLHVGEVGTGTLNINGGTIVGNGLFSVNSGGIAVPNPAVITATAGHGPYLGDYTYFEMGYEADHPTVGLPAAGSTIVSVTQGDHSYTLAPSYTANNAVILDAAIPSATITLATPQILSGLSFVGSAGNGPVIVNYTVNHASGAPDTGSLSVPDWFGTGQEVLNVEGRVQGTGLNPQYPGPAGGNPVGNAPYLLSTDISLVNTDKVVSISLTYVSGNGNSFATATLLGVSGQDVVGNPFNPLAISGYNADVVIEATAPSPYVSSSVMDTVTQTGGGINISNELWIAQGSTARGTYNLSGGTMDVRSWTVIGRSGGVATFNMTGGTINKTGGGNFIVGSAAGNNSLAGSSGTLNQSGGTINDANEYWLAENSLTTATNNISGTSVLNLNSWLSIGRGGLGVVNFSGGVINKNNNGAFIVADNGTAYFTQTGGAVNSDGELWIGQSGSSIGQYDLSAGTVTVNNWISIGRNGGNGTLNLTGGSITKAGGGNFSIGGDGGATGNLNQSGGTITNSSGITWLGQGGGHGNWTMNSGTAVLGVLQFCENGNGSGLLTLNGGVVSASEVNCGLAGANGTLSFNGGTLQATGDNVNFFHDLGAADIQAGGATIDSQGFNITVAQSLADNGGGGLTKIGTGSLTLSGANSYTGPTVVSAGTLAIRTDATANGGYSVASGAQLGLTALALNAQVNVASLTLASPSPALGFDLGNFGNPATAPLNVVGALTVNGTVAINITDGSPQIGQFPLIAYGSKTGAGTFVIGSLPLGVAATISNNVAANSIDLVIGNVNLPRWEGLAGGNWDIGLTTNWINIGDGLPTFYGEGNAVLFNDAALGTTTVNLTTTVNPSSVTIDNSTLAYTFSGSGKISGNTSLHKQGSATVTIANTGGNNFTGPTVISGGTVSVASLANGGAPSAIGASSANPTNLVLAGGALSYSGPSVAINRGYSVQTGGGTIDNAGNLTLSGLVAAAPSSGFTKTGSAQLAYTGVGNNTLATADYLVRDGTVAFDGSAGAQTNTVSGAFSVAGLANAVAILTNTTLTVNDNAVGNVAGSFGSMTVNNGTTLNVNSWLTLGDSANSVSTFTLNGGTVNVPNGRLFLCSAPGTMATLNINGGVINKNSGDIICIADGGWNGSGVRTGIVNQVGGTLNVSPEVQIGQVAGGTGVYNLHGGALNSTGWFVIGRAGGDGTFNMDGGVLTHTSGGQPAFIVGSGAGNNSAASVGVLNQSAGTINCTSEYWVAENTASTGTNNISGTAVVNAGSWVSLGRGGHAVINFSGGLFNKTGGGNFIVGEGAGNCLWNQTGGALSINNELWIGQAGGTTGEFDLSAGTVTNGSWFAIGREGGTGILNISGGSMTKNGGGNISIAHGTGASGTVNQTGGSFTCTSGETWIGEDNGPGIWNISGGTASFGYVQLARNSSATGTLNLNGGVVAVNEITTGSSGTSTLNFNGGTLAAQVDNTNFLHGLTTATVMSGAVIDSRTNVISVAQPLLDGGAGGGLTKIGNGTLYLNGINTYTGSTLVSTGTLGGAGIIAGPVSVASGATLAPGASIGTLTINNTLTLAAGSKVIAEVSLDGGVTNNDQVVGLTSVSYAGALIVTNVGSSPLLPGTVFKLFTSAASSGNFAPVTILPAGTGTFNPTTGELTITSSGIVTLNPVAVSGGKLILTGNGGTAGGNYTVLTSTNVATPVAGWTTNVSGTLDGSGAFSNAIPISVSEPLRFFRIRMP